MKEDQMKIDPNVLQIIIAIIDRYISSQIDILNNLLKQMKELSNDWEDEKTFGAMIKEFEKVIKNACDMFEKMRMVYKKFYYDEYWDIKRTLESLKV